MNIIQLSGHLADDVLNMTAYWPHSNGNIACFNLVTKSGNYSCYAYTDIPAIMNLKKGDHVYVEGALYKKTESYPPSVLLHKLTIMKPPSTQVTPKMESESRNCTPAVPSASTDDNESKAPSSGGKDNLDIDFKFIKL